MMIHFIVQFTIFLYASVSCKVQQILQVHKVASNVSIGLQGICKFDAIQKTPLVNNGKKCKLHPQQAYGVLYIIFQFASTGKNSKNVLV